MKRLRERQQRLAEQYLPLGISLGRRWAAWARLPPGDVIGAAMLGLCRAAAGHRSGLLPFPAYARIMIEGEIRRELRRHHRYRCRVLGAQVLEAIDRRDDLAGVERRDEAEAILRRLDRLSPREREAILLYIGGMRWVEVAEAMDIRPTSVERLRRLAAAKLIDPQQATQTSPFEVPKIS